MKLASLKMYVYLILPIVIFEFFIADVTNYYFLVSAMIIMFIFCTCYSKPLENLNNSKNKNSTCSPKF